jgi:hypothetical protein
VFNDVTKRKVLTKAPFENPSELPTAFNECSGCRTSEDWGIQAHHATLIMEEILKTYGYVEKANTSEINLNG